MNALGVVCDWNAVDCELGTGGEELLPLPHICCLLAYPQDGLDHRSHPAIFRRRLPAQLLVQLLDRLRLGSYLFVPLGCRAIEKISSLTRHVPRIEPYFGLKPIERIYPNHKRHGLL